MNELLQRYLDGELGLEELPAELREDARRWDRRVEESRAAAPSGMPAGLEARIVRAVAREDRRSTAARIWSWLTRPRPIAVSPLAGMAGATAAVALLAALWSVADPPVLSTTGDPIPVEVLVEFALEAPGARSVAVAGDFTTWTPMVELEDPDGDGIWSGRARLRPGIHKYMFVVDGSEWVTDPRAPRHVDDGFGNRNAVLVVSGGSSS